MNKEGQSKELVREIKRELFIENVKDHLPRLNRKTAFSLGFGTGFAIGGTAFGVSEVLAKSQKPAEVASVDSDVVASLNYLHSFDNLQNLEGNGHEPVTICHRTASHTNPYNVESPDCNSAQMRGHYTEHDGGVFPEEPWGDIIPPFVCEGTPYAGKNWVEAGQNIYDNGCEVPAEPTKTPEPTKTATPRATEVSPSPTASPTSTEVIPTPTGTQPTPTEVIPTPTKTQPTVTETIPTPTKTSTPEKTQACPTCSPCQTSEAGTTEVCNPCEPLETIAAALSQKVGPEQTMAAAQSTLAAVESTRIVNETNKQAENTPTPNNILSNQVTFKNVDQYSNGSTTENKKDVKTGILGAALVGGVLGGVGVLTGVEVTERKNRKKKVTD